MKRMALPIGRPWVWLKAKQARYLGGHPTLQRWGLLGLASAAILAGGIFAAWLAHSEEPVLSASSPLPDPLVLTGWSVGFPRSSEDSELRKFAGVLKPGQALFVPAGEPFLVQPIPAQAEVVFPIARNEHWLASGGQLSSVQDGGSGGRLVAPEAPGLYRIVWEGPAGRGGVTSLPIMTMLRAKVEKQREKTMVRVGEEQVGGYSDPLEAESEAVRAQARRYEVPRYFSRLDRTTIALPLPGNLTLGQMVAFMERRDAQGKKVFTTNRATDLLPPCPALYEKLGRLHDRLVRQGIRLNRFWITSGFRAPGYNARIGGAAFSRHCFGDAVDLCIDEDNDKHMDDLNGDGRLDRLDGLVIAKACLDLEREGAVALGGIGVYEYDGEDSVRSHVHIDCRGYRARWGQIHRGSRKLGYTWWSSWEPEIGEDGSE